MKDERLDASLLIGLHKLSEQTGDGQLQAICEHLTRFHLADNVVKFPAEATVSATTVPSWEAGKVLPFRR